MIKKLFPLYIFVQILLLPACQQGTANEIVVDSTLPQEDEVYHVITINGVGDTLIRVYNNTQQFADIAFKGENARLMADTTTVDIQFSNQDYVMVESHGETTIHKNGNLIFQFPSKDIE